MALAEINANSLMRNGNISGGSLKRSPTRELSFATGRSDSKAIRHNMIKITTETDDTGPLSVKQSRLPYPVARISPRKYRTSLGPTLILDASHTASLMTDEGPYAAIKRPAAVFRDRNISTASSIISMYRRESHNHAGLGAQQKMDQDCRSYSMNQASIMSYALSSHRSYGSLKDSRIPTIPIRPRSPFMYPTRLKRPGFRPSSPAFSDFGGDYRSTASLGTSSPASSYAKRRQKRHGQEPNKVYPSLLTTPTPSVHSRHHSKETPTSSRMGTPVQALTPPPGDSDPAVSSTDSRSQTEHKHQGTDMLSPPLYYDYTEGFENESYSLSRQTNSFPFLTIDRTIPEDRPVTTIPGGDNKSEEAGPRGPIPLEQSIHQTEIDGPPECQDSNKENSGTFVQPVGAGKAGPDRTDFREELRGVLENGSQLNPRSTLGRRRAGQSIEFHQNRWNNASPLGKQDHGEGQGTTSIGFNSPHHDIMREYSRPGFNDNTEIYTRLSARGRDSLSPYRRESGLGDHGKRNLSTEGKEELSWSAIPMETKGAGAASERPLSSYSRRSSIRRFFSSDQGFGELPEILTSFDAIGRPYTPDQFLKGEPGASMKAPSLKDPRTPKHYRRKAESASLKSLDYDLQFSRQDMEDGEFVKRSASKLTKRSLQEKQVKTLTVVGDISAVDGVPQTHIISREPSRHKRRISVTAQEEFQNSVSGISRARLMQQLPLLPVTSPEPSATVRSMGFPSMPTELLDMETSRSTENQGRSAGKQQGYVTQGGNMAKEINVNEVQSRQLRPGTPLETLKSPASLFSTGGRVVAIGDPESNFIVTGKNDEETRAVRPRFRVKTSMAFVNNAISGAFSSTSTGTGFQSSGSGEGILFQAANDIPKKVSFQDARHSLPPSPSATNVVTPRICDQGAHGRSTSQQRNFGNRIFRQDVGVATLWAGQSTGRDKHMRGRSNAIDYAPSARHANPSEPRSVFSDDSSHITSSRNTLKRLTNFRAKLPTLTASRRSRDSPRGPGHLERTVASNAPIKSRINPRSDTLMEAAGMSGADYKTKKLVSRVGSWFRRRRDHSRVVFKKFRRNRKIGTTEEKTNVCCPGV